MKRIVCDGLIHADDDEGQIRNTIKIRLSTVIATVVHLFLTLMVCWMEWVSYMAMINDKGQVWNSVVKIRLSTVIIMQFTHFWFVEWNG